MNLCKLFKRKPKKQLPPAGTMIGEIERVRPKYAPLLCFDIDLELTANKRAYQQSRAGMLDGHEGSHCLGREICMRSETKDPKEIIRRFMASPEHRTVITRAYWRRYGWDTYYNRKQGMYYIVIIFNK